MNTTSAPRLESAIRETFAPLLRSEGFAGTGRRFYKCSGHWVQVITVQGSRYGGAFAVNLGIHHALAPDFAGNHHDPKKMSEAHCDFRRRLSETYADMWWKHESNQASMLSAIGEATATYELKGRGYFELACSALDLITPEALASGSYDLQGFGSTKVRLGLALARIRKLEGRGAESRGFAAYGIAHLGIAGFLKSELLALAAT